MGGAVSDSGLTKGRKRVGLALGGGGARGMAHVGVIRVLEREGIPIDCIAGTSAGSLAGAAYAGGIRGHDLVELALRLRWRDIVRPVWPRQGFVSFARLEDFVAELLGDPEFADLEIPYAAMAADLATGEQVVLKEGRVAPAVQASCSVPGIATPVAIDGRLLADGGVVNNLPISAVRALARTWSLPWAWAGRRGSIPRGPCRRAQRPLNYCSSTRATTPRPPMCISRSPFGGWARWCAPRKGTAFSRRASRPQKRRCRPSGRPWNKEITWGTRIAFAAGAKSRRRS